MSSFHRIEKAILPLNLDHIWANQRSLLDGDTMARLQFCAHGLSSHYSEESINDDDLVKLVGIVDELYKSLIESSMPELLKLSLLEEIDRIKRSLALIQIKGAKGVKEALQALVGSVYANRSDINESESQNKDVIRRLGDLIDKLDVFTSRALKAKKMLTAPVTYFLENITKPDEDSEGDDEEVAV